MHSQYKDQVFRRDGTSYLVIDRCPESPDHVIARAIAPGRTLVRLHREEVETSLRNAGPARSERR
jgi:hypothetical protein